MVSLMLEKAYFVEIFGLIKGVLGTKECSVHKFACHEEMPGCSATVSYGF